MDFSSISTIKQLNTDQYQKCKESALKLVKKSIGDKPSRKQFAKEHASLFGILDILGLVVFVAAFLVSSVHILGYAGSAANDSYLHAMQNILGISIGNQLYGITHQLGLLALAEAAMLLFFVLFRTRKGFEKWVSLILAVMAMIFVITANLSSGLNGFLSLLAPAFTIGYGFRVEAIITENIKRNTEIDKRYQAALSEWELVNSHPEQSQQYKSILANIIWDKIVSLKANQEWLDAAPETKRLAVLRELQRDQWQSNIDLPEPNFLPATQPIHSTNGHSKIVPINQDI